MKAANRAGSRTYWKLSLELATLVLLCTTAGVAQRSTLSANTPMATQSLVFRSIDVPGATATGARGINAEHDIVGRYYLGTSSYGFLLSNGTLTTVEHPDGIGSTQTWGISPTGDVVGFYGNNSSDSDADQTHAFVRHPDGCPYRKCHPARTPLISARFKTRKLRPPRLAIRM
jgi:hypothetical protein